MSTSGLPVSGIDFFGRDHDLARFWDFLRQSNNLLLLAPRRVGKTSLMQEMRNRASAKGYKAKFLDLAAIGSESGFVQKLLQAIDDPSILNKIGQILAPIKKVSVAGQSIEFSGHFDEKEWRVVGEQVAQILADSERPWLLLLDEVPIFVNKLIRKPEPGRAREFLEWFRTLRHAAPKVRWMLSGSIGLDKVARDARMSDTINDLYLVTDFGPFPPQIARDFIGQLGIDSGFILPDEVRDHLIEKVGWLIPFHLRLLFDRHRAHCSGGQPSIASLDSAYEKLVSDRAPHLNWWDERIVELYGDKADRHVRAILRAAARAGNTGATYQTLRSASAKYRAPNDDLEEHNRLVGDLLDALVTDGYLRIEASARATRYPFQSALLRDYWLRFKTR